MTALNIEAEHIITWIPVVVGAQLLTLFALGGVQTASHKPNSLASTSPIVAVIIWLTIDDIATSFSVCEHIFHAQICSHLTFQTSVVTPFRRCNHCRPRFGLVIVVSAHVSAHILGVQMVVGAQF